MQKRRLSEVYRDLLGNNKLTNLLPNQPGSLPRKDSSRLEISGTSVTSETEIDWFEPAEIWIQDRIEAEGLRAIAPIEVVKVWALAIILRVKTTGGIVYFKAAAPLFAQESVSTRILAELYPENLPELLATNPDKNWLLMREIDGEILEKVGDKAGDKVGDKVGDIFYWQSALSDWAKLQISAMQYRQHLIGLGWLDLGLEEIPRQIGQLFYQNSGQAWVGGESFGRSQLWQLLPLLPMVPKFKAVCQQLSQLGIPDTLVHGDLSPRNIYVRDRGFVYFDWSDTCISHPFFDLIRFLYEIETDLPHVPDARSRIRNAYLEPWTIYAPMEQLISTFELVSETLVSLYEIIRDRLLRENGRNHWQWPTESAVPLYLQRLLIQVATYLHFSQKTK